MVSIVPCLFWYLNALTYSGTATAEDRSELMFHVQDKLNQTVANPVRALSTLVNILVDSTAMKALVIPSNVNLLVVALALFVDINVGTPVMGL